MGAGYRDHPVRLHDLCPEITGSDHSLFVLVYDGDRQLQGLGPIARESSRVVIAKVRTFLCYPTTATSVSNIYLNDCAIRQ